MAKGVIDLHCHLLPGVDDGPDTVEEAVTMCHQAMRDGCRGMVATPHQRHPGWVNEDRVHLETVFSELQEAVGEGLSLHLGAEIRVDSELLGLLERPQGPLLSLAGSRYLLLELPRLEVGPPPEDILHEVRLAGWRPILAHPELIPYLARDPARLEALVAAGALLQITAASLTGEVGQGIEELAWQMVRAGWVHFVASDCHSSLWRPPGLSTAKARLARELGEAGARRLVEDHPARVLADEPWTA